MTAQPVRAILFDLDGVLTDTAELHFQSWLRLAQELRIPFDRERNHALRGLGRRESLAVLLGSRAAEFSESQQVDFAARKNADYLERVARMTPADLLPGARELVAAARRAGFRAAVASSSRNAHVVLERLGIASQFDAIVDGNDAPRSKPDPQVFLLAAQRVKALPHNCVVIEDAESGVAAALAAGMRVVAVGVAAQLAPDAHLRCDSLLELAPAALTALLDSAAVGGVSGA